MLTTAPPLMLGGAANHPAVVMDDHQSCAVAPGYGSSVVPANGSSAAEAASLERSAGNVDQHGRLSPDGGEPSQWI